MGSRADNSGQHKPERWSTVTRWAALLASAALFIIGVELLQQSAHRLEPLLQEHLHLFVDGKASAIGASWVGAYMTLSGSVIAAIALALFDTMTLSGDQLLMMIYGSRFGAAGMIVLVGIIDVFKDDSVELRRGSTVGLLTFLLTFGIGIPALFLGIVASDANLAWLAEAAPIDPSAASQQDPGLLAQALDAVISFVSPAIAFILAAVVLLGGLKLLHRTLSSFNVERLANRAETVFRNHWMSFALGLGLTLLATSVAVSVGAIVPLHNRGVLDRDQLIPYILGANIGTFSDTLVIAWLMDRPEAFSLAMVVVVSMLLVTVAVLIAYRPFIALVDRLEPMMLRTKRRVLITMGILAALPVALIVTAFV